MRTEATDALKSIVSLMHQHDLSVSDVKQAYKTTKKEIADEGFSGDRSVNFFLYAGGALVLCGIGILIAILWADLNSVARVAVTLVPGICSFLLALYYNRSENLKQAAPFFFILSFLLQPTGLFVFLDEFFGGDDAVLGAVLVFGILSFQHLVVSMRYAGSLLLFFTLSFILGFVTSLATYMDIPTDIYAMAIGLGFFLYSGIKYLKGHKGFTHLFFGGLGSIMFFSGAVSILVNTIFSPLLVSLSIALMICARYSKSRLLYFFSIIFILCGLGSGMGFMPEIAANDTIGGLALIGFGTSLLLTSLWLRKENHHLSFFWFLLSSVLIYSGIGFILFDTTLEITYILFSLLGVYLALSLQNRTILAVSLANFIGYIVYYSGEHFADLVGWPILLIVIGFLFIGAGRIYVRYAKKFAQS